jgi:NADH:ubiquinone oxidoreductase subunit E
VDKSKHSIKICMGSSCFSRGNALNVEIIQRFVVQEAESIRVEAELSGTLCEGLCKEGPIISIDGTIYRNVTPTTIPDLLAAHFGKEA